MQDLFQWFPLLLMRPETADHALACFVRLVLAVLGPDSVSDEKVECGSELVILGIKV